MSWKDITLEEFMDAYNTYPPNGWIRFAYKYFSRSTERKNMKPSRFISFTLLGLLLVGLLGTAFNLPHALIGIVTYAYVIGLGVLVLYLLSAVLMNKGRLKKIAKKLGVNMQEYNWLSDKYF